MQTTRLARAKRVARRWIFIYFVVALVLSGCADRLILYPSRDPINIPGAQRLVVPGPAGPLEIWTMRSPAAIDREPNAYVIEFIGNASRAEYAVEYIADQWQNRPVEVWSLNYPGYGASAGSAKLKYLAPAALAAYDVMKRRAGNRPTFISAHSIGTTTALYVAAHRKPSGLILQNPPPLRRLIIGKFGWWNLWLAAGPVALAVPADLDSIANAAKATAPAIFILSGADTLVPPVYQQKVVDAYAGPKSIVHVPTAGHNDPVEGKYRVQLEQLIDDMWAHSIGQLGTASN
jgi:pimeloyl-ACP methyl ester carboxylesterase